MKFVKRINTKLLAYALEMIILYVIQFSPDAFPKVYGVVPNFLLLFAVSVAVLEGEIYGVFVGAFAGFLMDNAGNKAFGFNALVVALICYGCGLLVVYLMRNTLLTSVILGFCSLTVLGIIRWFFFYVIWGYPDLWTELVRVALPTILYSIVFMPVIFLLNRVITTHLSTD